LAVLKFFSNWSLIALLLSGSVWAEEAGYQLSAEDKAMITQSMKIMEDAKSGKFEIPDIPTPTPQLMQQTRELFGVDSPMVTSLPVVPEVSKQAPKQYRPKSPLPLEMPTEIFVLVSRSMPDAEMRAALNEAADMGAQVVFRGLNPGENIKSAFSKFRKLLVGMKNPPAVSINPLVFQDFNVDAVPALVIRDSLNSIWVEGLLNIQWLKDRMDRGDRGFQGIRGQTHFIAENDMIDEIKTRMAKLDMDKLKQNAYSNFWKAKGRFLSLPQAKKNNSRNFDPSVVVTADISDRNGRIIVKAGSRINPVAVLPLTKTIVVFDATNAKNLAFVDQVLKEKDKEGRGVILISTMLDTVDAFGHLSTLQSRFHRQVYLLNTEIRDRFGIDALPTTIVSNGKYLNVSEYNVMGGKL
jgi:conjugal transfer pilus assembly protein TraW